jgi:hypothetical protein
MPREVTMAASLPVYGPAPFTLDDLYDAVFQACKQAWDDGHREIASVTLPEGVLPELASLQNPITRTLIPVVRVPLVAVGEEIPCSLTPSARNSSTT